MFFKKWIGKLLALTHSFFPLDNKYKLIKINKFIIILVHWYNLNINII